MAKPIQEAWELLGEIMMGQRSRMLAIASEFDLAPAQVMALKSLEPGRPRPMSDLAEAMRCDNSNITGIVDRLEARGLVERRPGERDRRVKMLVLTDEGAALRERALARFSEPPPGIASLPPEDQRALRDILRRALGR